MFVESVEHGVPWLNVIDFLYLYLLTGLKKSIVLKLCLRCDFESIFSLYCYSC